MRARASMLLRSVAVWLCLMAAETVHGIVRTGYLAPAVGDFRARQIAVFTGSALIVGLSVMFIRALRPGTVAEALGIGVLWLVLTLTFELALGRYGLHASWARIAEDYNLRRGGLLPIGLLVLTMTPLLAARLRHVL